MGYYPGTEDLENPVPLKNILFSRMQRGMYTSDDAYLEIVEAFEQYEIFGRRKTRIILRDSTGKDIRLSLTIELADSLINMIYKRPLLAVKLMEEKALILNMWDEVAASVDVYEDGLVILGKLNVEVLNLSGLFSNRIAAYNLRYTRDSTKAFAYYDSAYKIYPFGINHQIDFEDMKVRDALRKIHLNGGIGMIKSSENDLAALKRLFFPLPDQAVLQPLLDAAIKEAEGK